MGFIRNGLDVLFSFLFGSGAAVFVLWLTPYQFVIKQAVLIWLNRLRASGAVTRYATPIATLAAVSAWVEWCFLRKLRSEFTAITPASSMLVAEKMVRVRTRMAKALAVCGLALFVKRASHLLDGNVEKLVALETRGMDAEVLSFRPSRLLLNLVTYPFRSLFQPIFLNIDKVPTERPLMFVSNHTIMAFDFPLLIWELFDKKGIALRALADHSHFQIPINGEILSNVIGAVDGTRHNVELLMKDKQVVFVYPGGAREVFKRTTDEKYQLFWGDRLGFAELAIQHGCTIVPVTNYGAEDMMSVAVDLPMGWLPVPFLWRSDRSFPLVKPESLQRIYFNFGEPIRTEEYRELELAEAARRVRDRTKLAIENDLKFLKAFQESDPHRFPTVARVSGVHALVNWIKRTIGLTNDNNNNTAPANTGANNDDTPADASNTHTPPVATNMQSRI